MEHSVSFTWLRRNLVATILAVAYLVMSVVLYEQGRVIDNQRVLIQELFGDSIALNALRVQQIRDHNEHKKSEK